MSYIPDNYDAFLRHEAEQERQLNQLPVCCGCNEHIQSKYAYEVDGELYCKECFIDSFRVRTEDYIE